MSRLLQRNPWVLFLLLFVVRIVTTMPVLKALTDAGVHPLVAKTASQLPTIIFLAGLVTWFRWWQQVGLGRRPHRLGLLDLGMVALPLLVPVIAIVQAGTAPATGFNVTWLLADALCVAFWEELYFRGILLHQFRTQLPRYAIWLSALLFGLAHAGNGAAGAATSFVIVQTAWTLLCGAGLAAVRIRTGSLPLLIAGHFVLNGLERLAAGQQAMAAPPQILALMVVVGLVLGTYGWWVSRQGFGVKPIAQ